MLKLQAHHILSVVFFLFAAYCNQPDKLSVSGTNMVKTENYKAGDCFEFKEEIKDFGLIFLDQQTYPDGLEFDLFPVKLDTTKNGIEKFTNGKVYLTSFRDFTKPDGKTEGFIVYHFLSQKDFTLLNKLCRYSGSISLKDRYKNVTGGLMASSINEFRSQLNMWEQLFNTSGKLVSIEEISR